MRESDKTDWRVLAWIVTAAVAVLAVGFVVAGAWQ